MESEAKKLCETSNAKNNTVHLSECSECPLGTYQPDQGQRECILCGQNFTTALNGTSKESDCIGNFS